MNEIPEGTVCKKCNQRLAEGLWVGEGGILAATHGMGSPWCKVCMLKEQIKHCKKMMNRLPELEAELEAELAK